MLALPHSRRWDRLSMAPWQACMWRAQTTWPRLLPFLSRKLLFNLALLLLALLHPLCRSRRKHSCRHVHSRAVCIRRRLLTPTIC